MFLEASMDTVEMLDLDTMTWSAGPSMPQDMDWAQSEVYDNKLIVLGGYSNFEGPMR